MPDKRLISETELSYQFPTDFIERSKEAGSGLRQALEESLISRAAPSSLIERPQYHFTVKQMAALHLIVAGYSMKVTPAILAIVRISFENWARMNGPIQRQLKKAREN